MQDVVDAFCTISKETGISPEAVATLVLAEVIKTASENLNGAITRGIRFGIFGNLATASQSIEHVTVPVAKALREIALRIPSD